MKVGKAMKGGGGVIALVAALAGGLLIPGCGLTPEAQTKTTSPPAKIQRTEETGLTTLTLTPEAEKRIGIRVQTIGSEPIKLYRSFAGEVIVPEGRVQVLSSPVAGVLAAPAGSYTIPGAAVRRGQGLFRLVPLEREARGKNLRAEADKELASAGARVEAAQSRFQRAEQLLGDGAGSVKNLEEARSELTQAQAAQKAAREQIEYLSRSAFNSEAGLLVQCPADGVLLKSYATPGQIVPAGAPLAEIASLNPIWIRVPVYVGELKEVNAGGIALVHEVGGGPTSAHRQARRIAGIPTATTGAATVDLFFEISNVDLALRPGQRVGVSLAMQHSVESRVIPWSAVLHDVNGGTWVYENTAPRTYVRRRVEVRFVNAGLAALGRGPGAGAKIVTTGAAELFGAEYGVGK